MYVSINALAYYQEPLRLRTKRMALSKRNPEYDFWDEAFGSLGNDIQARFRRARIFDGRTGDWSRVYDVRGTVTYGKAIEKIGKELVSKINDIGPVQFQRLIGLVQNVVGVRNDRIRAYGDGDQRHQVVAIEWNKIGNWMRDVFGKTYGTTTGRSSRRNIVASPPRRQGFASSSRATSPPRAVSPLRARSRTRSRSKSSARPRNRSSSGSFTVVRKKKNRKQNRGR